MPAEIPETNPAALTVAIAMLLLLQPPVPPPGTTPFVVYIAVPAIHNGLVPVTEVIAALGFIVTGCCAEMFPPQPPEIV